MIKERRQFIRLRLRKPLKHMRFSLIGFDIQQAVLAETKDFSAGGVLFESKVPYVIGDIVRMEIEIPGWEKYKTEFYKSDHPSKSDPVVVLAKVVRVEILSANHFDIGVSFVGIDDGHQMALVKYIQQHNKS